MSNKGIHSEEERVRAYFAGELTAAEMHALEKEALLKPLLNDLLLAELELRTQEVDKKEALERIQKRIQYKGEKKKFSPWWKYSGIAAAVVLLVLLGYQVVNLGLKTEEIELATIPAQKENISPKIESATPSKELEIDEQPKEIAKEKVLAQQKKPITETERDKSSTLASVEERTVTQVDEVQLPEVTVRGYHTQQKKSLLGNAVRRILFLEGRVKSKDDGSPLPGAIVSIKGTDKVVLTGKNGSFKLEMPDSSAVISVDYVGFDRKELALNEFAGEIELVPDHTALSEIVVTGYDGTYSENRKAEPLEGWKAFKASQTILAEYSGKVVVSFEIDEEGEMQNIKFKKRLNDTADKRVLEILDQFKLWRPETFEGEFVKSRHRVKFNFKKED
ncbi:carboxypeptidase-like regulatory domain-containing protein [Marinilongibacter aquaticus]|uniref:carboxypeptidase-like regulatory domain-containing protein n=1 Tax=Marinilongibacter aquaticus TaxID=2975157 RepID=UPI0021BD7C54|nr:carboxypeptidase-like regulatory domain-containing protein [Marinilongibacter aquaticus]UBM57790.1 carboxypeptidase-like regulatory domain-containing protein [Marinilongibacter aquaticus]